MAEDILAVHKPRTVEIIVKSIAYDGYFKITDYLIRHELYGGGMSREVRRELFERGNAAAVLPYDPVLDRVVLLEQFRIAAHVAGDDAWMLEIVAGMIDPGETPEVVVRREAQEEAGLTVRRLEPVLRYYTSPGALNEQCWIFVGEVDASAAGGVHGLAEEGEDIRVLPMTVDEALALLGKGRILASPAVIALQWLTLQRDNLRRRWLA